MKDNHHRFMLRALELAQKGMGQVSPNPMVGCVIVHDNKIIGEGYHHRVGEAHAEVNAIASVADKSLLSNSTLYVTLEPCAHFGKTPPCADLIVKHNIPSVVICNTDPYEQVDGKGIQKLKDSRINVEIGLLSERGTKLNQRFFTSVTKKRPFVILKWAQTQDGFVARKNFDSKWISNPLSRKLVHKWRSEEDAILVGYNTALHDNPSLTTRDWRGKNPIRVVIDRNLELPQSHQLFDGKVFTICFNEIKDDTNSNLRLIKVDFQHLEEQVLNELHKLNVQSIIVEGGSSTLKRFIEKNLWDEARVFTGNATFGEGVVAPVLEAPMLDALHLQNDILQFYRNDLISN